MFHLNLPMLYIYRIWPVHFLVLSSLCCRRIKQKYILSYFSLFQMTLDTIYLPKAPIGAVLERQCGAMVVMVYLQVEARCYCAGFSVGCG